MNRKLIGNAFSPLRLCETFYAEKGALVYNGYGNRSADLNEQIKIGWSAKQQVIRRITVYSEIYKNTNLPHKLVVSGRFGSLKYITIHNQQNFIIRISGKVFLMTRIIGSGHVFQRGFPNIYDNKLNKRN